MVKKYKITRFICAAAMMATVASSASASLQDGLQAWYTFDNASDLYFDSSGNNNTPTSIVGTPTQGTGKVGSGSLKLNGSSGLLINETLGSTPQFTVSAWAKLDDPFTGSSYNIIASKISSADASGWNIYQIDETNRTRQYIASRNTGGETYLGGAASNISQPGNWNLITLTYDGSELAMFINGILVTSDEKVITANTTTALSIGMNNFGNARFFNGELDEVAIWSRALSGEEVGQLFSGAQIPESSSIGLILGGAIAGLLIRRRMRTTRQ